MRVDIVKIVAGVIAGSVIYRIGKEHGYNEHVDKCKDVLIKNLVDQQEKKES